jgi:hypothetical protein
MSDTTLPASPRSDAPLSARQAAKRLGIDPRTLKTLKGLRRYRIGAREKYMPADLDAYLKGCEVREEVER